MAEVFQQSITSLTQRFARLWSETAPQPFTLGKLVSGQEKRRTQEKAEAAARDFEQLLTRFPKGSTQRGAWRQELLSTMKQMARDCLLLPEKGLDLFFTEPAMEVTRQFVTQGHDFDATMRDEHLFQALRNVWVLNFIELLLGREPSLSRAGFGYSMLYPCTDNFLDDPAVPELAKVEFGHWLGLRLQGLAPRPADPHGREVDRLVRLIESDYPRASYPEVFSCLGAIHRAQMESLSQHQPHAAADEESLIALTFTKGGTSVLSDAYIVSGRPAPAEAEFSYGYGIALQLMDDLQDVKTDRENGHTTLFTRALAGGPLDSITRRLWHFLRSVLEPVETIGAPRARCVRNLIQENCLVLFLQSVVSNPNFFTPVFARELESGSPFHLDFVRSQKERLSGEFRRIVGYLRRRRRIRSLLDLLK